MNEELGMRNRGEILNSQFSILNYRRGEAAGEVGSGYPRLSAMTGRAVSNNVGSVAAATTWNVGSQHCLRGHSRGARRQKVASPIQQRQPGAS